VCDRPHGWAFAQLSLSGSAPPGSFPADDPSAGGGPFFARGSVVNATTLLVVVCAASCGLYTLAWLLVLGWVAWHRRDRRHGDAAAPIGVSILKPLCGADDELERNLTSFFRLDHEPLQLVFGVANPADPALALVRRLARRHPERDVAIVVGATADAASPKVGLMETLFPRARHDIVLLSDSDVRVSPGEIGRVLPGFADPRVGMIYQPVVGVGERRLPAAIENLHYTELAAFLAIAARLCAGQHVVNAKGQWVRRAALADIGHFSGVRDNGADDYMLSRLMLAAGWRLALSGVPVRTVHRDWSWQALAHRHLRHAGLRRRLCPWAYPLELLLNPVPWTLLLLATPHAAWSFPLVALKVALEVSAARLLRGVPLAWRHAAIIPLKDLGYFLGWFASFAVRTVSWRGRTYAIGAGARLIPLDPPAEPAIAARAA
jgi:ceramide glucosyltransferase